MATQNLGRVGLVLKGEWDSATSYTALDVVSHDGNAWAAKQNSTNVEPTTGNSAFWQLFSNNADLVATVQGLKEDAANSAAAAAASAQYGEDAFNAIAHTFDPGVDYTAGKYVWYNGELYRFNAAHPAGAWIGTDAVRYTATDEFPLIQQALGTKADAAEVADLKSAINDLEALNPEGIVLDTTNVTAGAWKNANVGDTVTEATNNNDRRGVLNLSDYIGWTLTYNFSTANLSTGAYSYLCNASGVISEKFTENVAPKLNGTPLVRVITADNCYFYYAYDNRYTVTISAKVESDVGKDIASIPELRVGLESAVKPITFLNLCENPNIDDLTGFSVNSAATISAADNVLTITPTARNSETTYTVPTALQNGHRYYLAVGIKSNYTGNGLFVRIQALKSGSTTQAIGTTKYNGASPNTWQRLSVVTDAAPDYTTLRLNIYCSSTGLEAMYAKQIVIIDLTDVFGAGNEPDVGTIDTMLASYTDGAAFFEGTLGTDIILNAIYPDPGAGKPIFVGISGYVMNVNAKYSATQDIRYKVGKAGSNELFNWRGFDFIDNSTDIVSPKVDLSQAITVITDWFGPHKLKVAANADGDMPDSDNFTGGNHAYNGDSTGTPTARTASYAFYVDGRKVTSFLGYAYYVDVYWQNYVQATNTKKSDGTGREVLKETIHMHFDADKWTINGMLEPLEALASWSYYGIQMSRASAYNGYIFYHDCPENRTWHATNAASSAGANTCHTITMHDGADYFDMHVGIDGLGNFALNPNDSSFFSSDSKTYSNLIKGATGIAANSVYTYDGWYKWYNMSLD